MNILSANKFLLLEIFIITTLMSKYITVFLKHKSILKRTLLTIVLLFLLFIFFKKFLFLNAFLYFVNRFILINFIVPFINRCLVFLLNTFKTYYKFIYKGIIGLSTSILNIGKNFIKNNKFKFLENNDIEIEKNFLIKKCRCK